MKTAATKFAKLAPSLAPLLEDLRAAASFTESDSVAVIRRYSEQGEAIAWLPVFLRESDGAACVRIDGSWREVESIRGFERYQKVRRKQFLNTATGKMVEV